MLVNTMARSCNRGAKFVSQTFKGEPQIVSMHSRGVCEIFYHRRTYTFVDELIENLEKSGKGCSVGKHVY